MGEEQSFVQAGGSGGSGAAVAAVQPMPAGR